MRIRCLMMPRCRGVVSRSSLQTHLISATDVPLDLTICFLTSAPGLTDLFLFPASSSPSTVELMVPSAPSTTFSHVLRTSHVCCAT